MSDNEAYATEAKNIELYHELNSIRENMNALHESVGVLKGRLAMGADVTDDLLRNVADANQMLMAANNCLDRCL